MFEKEAEEEINKVHWNYSIFKDLAQEYWQKGAEFGYNKAKEEMQKNGLALQSDMDKTIEQNIQLKNRNAELKRQVEQKQHLADVRLEQSLENYKLFSDEQKERIDVDIALDNTTDQLTYAKTIIQDLLDNTDEYARQRAEDFLQEIKEK